MHTATWRLSRRVKCIYPSTARAIESSSRRQSRLTPFARVSSRPVLALPAMAWRSRLTSSLHELRVVYCAQSSSSAGTRCVLYPPHAVRIPPSSCEALTRPSLVPRAFLTAHYKDLKTANPSLPIYLRPCDGASPHVAARYGKTPPLLSLLRSMNEAPDLAVFLPLPQNAVSTPSSARQTWTPTPS